MANGMTFVEWLSGASPELNAITARGVAESIDPTTRDITRWMLSLIEEQVMIAARFRSCWCEIDFSFSVADLLRDSIREVLAARGFTVVWRASGSYDRSSLRIGW